MVYRHGSTSCSGPRFVWTVKQAKPLAKAGFNSTKESNRSLNDFHLAVHRNFNETYDKLHFCEFGWLQFTGFDLKAFTPNESHKPFAKKEITQKLIKIFSTWKISCGFRIGEMLFGCDISTKTKHFPCNRLSSESALASRPMWIPPKICCAKHIVYERIIVSTFSLISATSTKLNLPETYYVYYMGLTFEKSKKWGNPKV